MCWFIPESHFSRKLLNQICPQIEGGRPGMKDRWSVRHFFSSISVCSLTEDLVRKVVTHWKPVSLWTNVNTTNYFKNKTKCIVRKQRWKFGKCVSFYFSLITSFLLLLFSYSCPNFPLFAVLYPAHPLLPQSIPSRCFFLQKRPHQRERQIRNWTLH